MGFAGFLYLLVKMGLFLLMVLAAAVYSTARSGVRGGLLFMGALAFGLGAAVGLRAFSLVGGLSLTSLACLVVGLCYVGVFLSPPRIGLLEKVGASLGVSMLAYFSLELLKAFGVMLADSFLVSAAVFLVLVGLALLSSARGEPR